MVRFSIIVKWLTPGIGVKRWLILIMAGIFLIAVAITYAILKSSMGRVFEDAVLTLDWPLVTVALVSGVVAIGVAIIKLSRNILAPYRKHQQGTVIDVVYAHSKRYRGQNVVAIGGGTGLPSVLRGLKSMTSNITAIVTVADDGGSSGKLRREMGVLPPGDLRNNIAALADDESLMTRLFQYRFQSGDLEGHSFGNLLIAALAAVVEEDHQGSSIAEALVETERVLNIQGRVLPATLEDVKLVASVRLKDTGSIIKVQGESQITSMRGQIEDISLMPPNVAAYSESVHAIQEADLVVIGPGSLYTSLLPNLMVSGIADALRATDAYKIYVCNVATQPGETGGYTVAEHVMALEQYIGRGVFQVVLANNHYPALAANSRTRYVEPAPANHEILQRYEVRYTDLVDRNRPWRHDPHKLADALLRVSNEERSGSRSPELILTEQV